MSKTNVSGYAWVCYYCNEINLIPATDVIANTDGSVSCQHPFKCDYCGHIPIREMA